MRKNRLFLLCAFSAASIFLLHTSPVLRVSAAKLPTDRNPNPLAITSEKKEIPLYEHSYALVIGVSKYERDWKELPGVQKDVARVTAILEKHGFQVTPLENPNHTEFRATMLEFIGKYGLASNHRLLIYFAGHGATHFRQDGVKDGYLIPADCPLQENGPELFKQRAVSMTDMEGYASKIEAKHALFVFDSCFSGSWFDAMRSSSRVGEASKAPPLILDKVANPVRQFITAGTGEQMVPDESMFCEQFERGLEGRADLNEDGFITGSELGMFLENKVAHYSHGTQTPRYGKIRNPKLDRGDVVFIVNGKLEERTPERTKALPVTVAVRPLSPNARAEAFYTAGLAALREGSYFKASKALDEAIQQDPEFPLAYAQRAEALLELDYQERAKEVLLHPNALSNREKLLPVQQLYLDAMRAVARRDFAAAIEAYLKIERQVVATDKSYVQLDLGRTYEKNEQIELALASYQKTIKLDSMNATAWLRLGILYGRKQQDQEAENAFSQARKIYETLSNLEGQAEVFYQRGFIARSRSKLIEARSLLQQASKLAEAIGNTSQQALTLLHLGSIDLAEGKVEEAEKSITKIKELTDTEGLQTIYLRALIDLGNVLLSRGKLREAESYYQQAYNKAKERKAIRSLARALLSLGSVHYAQGRIDDEVVGEIKGALEFYRSSGYRSEESSALLLLARIDRKKGNYEAALKSFQAIVVLAEQLADKGLLAFASEGVADVLMTQGQYPKAILAYESCRRINRELNDNGAVAYNLLNLGNLSWQLGKYSEASNYFAELERLPIEKYEGLVTFLHLARAEMLLSQLQFAKARVELAAVADNAEDEEILLTKNRLSALLEGLSPNGDKRKARILLTKASKIADKLNNPFFSASVLLTQAEIELRNRAAHKVLEVAHTVQDLLAKDGPEGYVELLWRSYQLAAIANKQLKRFSEVEKFRTQASGKLAQLEEKWGNSIHTYRNRPDVKQYLQRLR